LPDEPFPVIPSMLEPKVDQRRRLHRRIAKGLAVAIVILLGCGAGCGLMTGYLPVRLFDSASWKTPETSYTRVRMVEALLLTHDLDAMTRSEVIDLLGQPPPTNYFSDWDLVYHLGPERSFFSLDSEWLVFRFRTDGQVSEWAVVSD
jgi:hypothetical protein